MEYRKIADGKLEVSTICIGCWAIVGDATWGAQDKPDAIAALRTALDEGVNFFDTAEGYGAGYSEQLIGEALGADRDKVVIASKVSRSHLGAAEMPIACERSLKNLATDYIDIYYIHWPNWLLPFEETVRAMEKLIESGKVRHLAVSNFGPRDLADILPLVKPVANQMAYNLLFRAVEHEVLPLCRQAGVPLTCYCPIMQGLLAGKFATADDVPPPRARTRLFSKDRPEAHHNEPGAEAEAFAAIAAIRDLADEAGLDMAAMSLAWLIGREGVGSVIVGSRSAEQSRSNAAAGDLKLSPDVVARLDEITAPVKEKLGPACDLWQSGTRIR